MLFTLQGLKVKDDQEMAAQSWESSVTLVVYDTGYEGMHTYTLV